MHLSARRTYFVQQLPDAACAIADEHNAMIANADLTLISKYSKATTRIAPDCNHETANLLSWLIGAHGVGIDINSIRIAEAKENAKKAGVEKLVWFEENDLFDADIREATAVTLFLPNSVNEKLRPKLLKDLKPGTRVVANAFGRGDWRPDQEMNVADPVERFSSWPQTVPVDHSEAQTKSGARRHGSAVGSVGAMCQVFNLRSDDSLPFPQKQAYHYKHRWSQRGVR